MVMSREAATPRGERRAARIAGALFLIAMAASLFGGAVVSAELPAPGNSGALDARGLLSGGLIELVNAFAVVGIAACLFPVLKRHGERAALGFLCFRVAEALFCALAAIVPLMLVSPDGQPWAMEEGTLYALAAALRYGWSTFWSRLRESAFPGNYDGAGASDDFERSFPGVLASCEGICPPVRLPREEGSL